MIDLSRLRNDFNQTRDLILRKEPSFDIERLVELDKQVRKLNAEIESVRKNKNDLASIASKGISEEIRKKSIELGQILETKESELEKIREQVQNVE